MALRRGGAHGGLAGGREVVLCSHPFVSLLVSKRQAGACNLWG